MSDYMDFPFHVDQRGRSATTDADDHVRDLIEQVLFTTPGERVNRPDFGCGLLQLVFMPNSDVLSAATQFLVQGALQRWLSDVIQVEQGRIDNVDERHRWSAPWTRNCVAALRTSLFGMNTSCRRPQPKSGRFTRSPGVVKSTCSMRSRTWSSASVVALRPR